MNLIVKSLQTLCHGQFDLDILFVKLAAHMQCLFLFVTSCKMPQLQSFFRYGQL